MAMLKSSLLPRRRVTLLLQRSRGRLYSNTQYIHMYMYCVLSCNIIQGSYVDGYEHKISTTETI